VTPPERDEAAGARPGFPALFAALPVAVLVIDPADRVAHANALAEETLNLSERVMLGRPLAAILPTPAEGRSREGEAFAAYDVAMETARGRRIRVDFAEAAVPNHPGWRTVTLHSAAANVGRGTTPNRAATGAAAMLAHEVRNPLSGIRGAAQLIGSGELPRLIVREVDRIAALIDRVQHFGDSGPLPLQAANIYPLLEHARGVARAGFARHLPIEERFDPSLPPARINPDAMLQIMINLLSNASHAIASMAEPRIVIATAFRHGMAVRAAAGGARVALPIEIAVLDNGPGAPSDIADQLFDPFVSGRPGGQGLGLALADKLVRDMGGIIQYAREGSPIMTHFRLLLPRAEV